MGILGKTIGAIGIAVGVTGAAWFVAKKLSEYDESEIFKFGIDAVNETGKLAFDVLAGNEDDREFAKAVTDFAAETGKSVIDWNDKR